MARNYRVPILQPELLKESVETALNDRYTRAEDLVFYSAVTGWGSCIQLGSFDGYRERFEETAAFFKDRLVEGKDLSTQMINEIARKTNNTSSLLS